MSDVIEDDEVGAAESGHTRNRMSARAERIEVITRGERRRNWTVEQKRVIAAESLLPGVMAAEVARRHGIGSGLLYTWRKQMLRGELGEAPRRLPGFVRVAVAPVERPEPIPAPEPPPLPAPAEAPRLIGLIEIVLPGGVVLRVDERVSAPALRRVLDVLERR